MSVNPEVTIRLWIDEVADYLDTRWEEVPVRIGLGGWDVVPNDSGVATIGYVPYRAGIRWNASITSELQAFRAWPAARESIEGLIRQGHALAVQTDGLPSDLATALVLFVPLAEDARGDRLVVTVDRARVDARFAETMSFLRSPKRSAVRWIIPLSPDLDNPVELEPDVFLRCLSPADLAWAFNLQILRSPDPTHHLIAPTSYQYQYTSFELHTEELAPGEQLESFDTLLEQALVLSVWPPKIPVGWFSAWRLSPPPAGSMSRPRGVAVLERSPRRWSRSEIDAFGATWHLLRQGGPIPESIQLALRRLALSSERKLAEDTTIDLMIAAEALYLSEGQSGELSYRASVRAGLWLDDATPVERLRVKNLFKTAYGARSKVAHGAKLKPSELRVDGAQMTLDSINSEVLRVLVQACNRAVRESKAGHWPPNWDALLFGATPTDD